MEIIVICLDNSINLNDEELSILDFEEDLKQQIIATQAICKHIWRSDQRNRVGIVKFAPKGDVVQQLTTDSSLLIKALANIEVEENMNFPIGFKRACSMLSQCKAFRKRLIVFVKNLLNYSYSELNGLFTKIPQSIAYSVSDELNVDLISIGKIIKENRPKILILENLFELDVFRCYEVKETKQNGIMKVLVGSRVLEVIPSDLEEILELIRDNNGEINREILALDNDFEHNYENVFEKRLIEIESQKQAINNDKGVDPQTRDFILQTLENELKEMYSSEKVSNKSSFVKLSEPIDDDDIKKAIENSLKENYKKDSVKGLVDGLCNAFKEQNNQKTIENNDKQKTNSIKQKPKRVIKKFREKTKY